MGWSAVFDIWIMLGVLYGPWLPCYLLRKKGKFFMFMHRDVYKDTVVKIFRMIPGIVRLMAIAAMATAYQNSPRQNKRHYNNFMGKK